MPLQVTFQTNEIQNYLRVDPGLDDLVIDGMKAAALLQAENFLNTDFTSITTTVKDSTGTALSIKKNYTGHVDPLPAETTVINDDGTTTTTTYAAPSEAPAEVKLWIMSRVAQLYENRGQAAMPDYTLLQPYRLYPFRG